MSVRKMSSAKSFLTGPTSESDYYRFEAKSGQLLTVELLSESIRQRVSNFIDSIVRVYDDSGSLLDYYGQAAENDDGFDNRDSIFIDLQIPADGTYFVEVDTFAGSSDIDTGQYELFLYTFDPDTTLARQGGPGDTINGAEGEDVLLGAIGDDLIFADETDLVINTTIHDTIVLPTGARVEKVFVSSSTWGTEFLGHVGPFGYEIPLGPEQLLALPWTDLDEVSIRFTSNVTVDPTGLEILGEDIYDTDDTLFSYDATTFTATWKLAAGTPLPKDRLLLTLEDTSVVDANNDILDGDWVDQQTQPSGDFSPGTDFVFKLNVLPGDVDGSGVVQADDASDVRIRQNTNFSQSTFEPRADIDGSGVVQADDFRDVTLRQNQALPFLTPAPAASIIDLIFAANQEDMRLLEQTIENDEELPPPRRPFRAIQMVRRLGSRRLRN